MACSSTSLPRAGVIPQLPEICEEIEAETIRFIAKMNQGCSGGPAEIVVK
jgi:hypothetical protein